MKVPRGCLECLEKVSGRCLKSVCRIKMVYRQHEDSVYIVNRGCFNLRAEQVGTGQLRTGEVRKGQIRTSQLRKGQFRTCQLRKIQVRAWQIRKVKSS